MKRTGLSLVIAITAAFLWVVPVAADETAPPNCGSTGPTVYPGASFAGGGTWTDLGTLPQDGVGRSYAAAINNTGAVVGGSTTQFGWWYHAVVWQDGLMTDLGAGGDFMTGAVAVNDRGQVVVSCSSANPSSSFSRAFLWEDGIWTELGMLPGGGWTGGTAINSAGDVAGVGWTASGDRHAVLWRHGAVIDLHATGGQFPQSQAFGINDRGEVVGQVYTADFSVARAFVWRDGTLTVLPSDLAFSTALAINRRGQVVGQTGWFSAAIWNSGSLAILPTPTGGASSAADINDRGDVLGTLWSDLNQPPHSVIWTHDGVRDLGAQSDVYGAAINNRSQVAGRIAVAAPGGNATEHAAIWGP